MRQGCLLLLCAVSMISAAAYNYGEALQKAVYFYECQQSGPLPPWNRVQWRGNSCLSDGRDVGRDLTGGWFDAGDHVKFNFPMAFTVTMLAWGGLEYKEAYQNSGQLPHLLRNIRFATDYLMRCHTADNELYGQVGKGSLDHSFWGPAESVEHQMERPAYKIDAQKPGSDLAGETAAALAAAALLFAQSDASYAAQLLTHARRLYTFAETYKGKYSDAITDAQGFYNSWSGYNDELVWAAVWLYKATGEQTFLTKAESLYDNLNTQGQQPVRQYKWTIAWDDKSFGCYVLLAALTNKDKYHTDARRWLDYWTTGYNGERISYTPGGLAWLDQWGANRYAANTAFCAFVYAKSTTDQALQQRYVSFAEKQIKYMLGDNPLNRSFVVGFGANPPRRPHHRTCHGYYPSQASDTIGSRHTLYGALVGGPGTNDNYQDDRNNYVNNEVACDYNAAFTGALAAMYAKYGGEPLAGFPSTVQPQAEFFVEASINVAGERFTEVRAVLMNKSAWPARAADSLSFRYFVDLSEVLSAGFSLSDIAISRSYAQGSSRISELTTYDASRNLYYVEVAFHGDVLYPGTQDSYKREVQFRIALPNSAAPSIWKTSNDWSCQNLQSGYSNQKVAVNIPVYSAGDLIWGAEPRKDAVGIHGGYAHRTETIIPAGNRDRHTIYSVNGRSIPGVARSLNPCAPGIFIGPDSRRSASRQLKLD